jgi:hypothetical protein
VNPGSFRPESGAPPEFLTASRPSDLAAGNAFLEVSAPFNGTPQTSPVWSELSRLAPDPLAGFLNLSAVCACPSCAALFHAAAVPGLPPFRAFPSQRSWSPLEATGSLAVIHRRQRRAACDLVTASFTRRPRRETRWPSSPSDYELPFDEPKPVSRSLWVAGSGVAPSADFIHFEALFPLRVRSRLPGKPDLRSLLSWSSASLKTCPNLGASDPFAPTLARLRPPRRERLTTRGRTRPPSGPS